MVFSYDSEEIGNNSDSSERSNHAYEGTNDDPAGLLIIRVDVSFIFNNVGSSSADVAKVAEIE